jgi:hypothetical protein
MFNLFIIDNPWRFINAIEALNHFKTTNNILVIRKTKNDKNTQQVNNLINKSDWHKIIYMPVNNRSNFINYVKIIKQLKLENYNNIFISWDWFDRLVFANLNFKQAYTVDDGTSIINIYKQIKNNTENVSLKNKLKCLLFGLKIKSNKSINFFTSFNLSSFDKHLVVKNNLSTLTKSYKLIEFKKTNAVYIIGQPLVTKNMISSYDYLTIIKTICNHFIFKFGTDIEIIYIPHRDENIDAKHLLRKNNIKIMNINQPIEKYFLESKIFPSCVVSFFSTALFNLDFIFNENANCYFYEIPENTLLGYQKTELLNTLEYFKYTNVKKLEI